MLLLVIILVEKMLSSTPAGRHNCIYCFTTYGSDTKLGAKDTTVKPKTKSPGSLTSRAAGNIRKLKESTV